MRSFPVQGSPHLRQAGSGSDREWGVGSPRVPTRGVRVAKAPRWQRQREEFAKTRHGAGSALFCSLCAAAAATISPRGDASKISAAPRGGTLNAPRWQQAQGCGCAEFPSQFFAKPAESWGQAQQPAVLPVHLPLTNSTCKIRMGRKTPAEA